jgi:hypothetical protein
LPCDLLLLFLAVAPERVDLFRGNRNIKATVTVIITA